MDKPFVPISRGGFEEWREGIILTVLGVLFLGTGHMIGSEIGAAIDEKNETIICVRTGNESVEICEADSTDDGFVRGAHVGGNVGLILGSVCIMVSLRRGHIN